MENPSLRPKPPGDGPRFAPAEISLYLVHTEFGSQLNTIEGEGTDILVDT